LKLFYPNLTAEERVIVEPLLQEINPPAIEIAEVEDGLKIVNKMILYKKQSKAKEDRKSLEKFLMKRRNKIQETIESYYKMLKSQS
jgi:hypothetical protein